MGAGADIVSGAVSGVVAGVVATVIIALAVDHYGDRWATQQDYLNPSCAHPKGLRAVPSSSLAASGSTKDDEKFNRPSKAVDGYAGSVWLPPTKPPAEETSHVLPVFDASTNTLSIKFLDGAHEVRLVCVNNGLGGEEKRFQNFGKVKSLKVWADNETSKAITAALTSLPFERSGDLQDAGTDLGTAKIINLQVIDAYAGNTNIFHDPDVCESLVADDARREFDKGSRESSVTFEKYKLRYYDEHYKRIDNNQPLYEPGCIVGATPSAGLSEVVLYEPDPNDPAPGWVG